MQFIEKPVNKSALSSRRLILGVGTNDAAYQVNPKIDGENSLCRYYSRWHGMLKRCYHKGYQEKHPSYIGCAVCTDWLTFSNFKTWMINQDWKDKHLDKDLLIQGNKVYSPETCLFVSQQINTLLNNCRAKRGDYPQGVCWNKAAKKFTAEISFAGKRRSVSYFETVKLAYAHYKKEKYILIRQVALEQCEPLRAALLSYKIQ